MQTHLMATFVFIPHVRRTSPSFESFESWSPGAGVSCSISRVFLFHWPCPVACGLLFYAIIEPSSVCRLA